MELIGELLVICTALFFSLSNIYNRRAMEQMDRDHGMIITLIVNNVFYLLLLAGIIFFNGITINMQAVIWFVLAGAATSFVGRQVLLESIKVNGAPRAGAYKVSSPVFTIIIGIGILGEKINMGSIIGIVICIAGIWFVSVKRINNDSQSTEKPEKFNFTGLMLGLGSGLAMAVGLATRKVGLDLWSSPVAGALIGSIVGLILMYISFLARGKNIYWKYMLDKRAVNFYYSGLCTSVAILLFFFGIELITVTVANVIASMESIFTVVLSVLMLRSQEKITPSLVAGAALVTFGVSLIFIY
ncbi:MAG: DMT family transporter [Clostridiales bacterium]|nr:DMT family transporter [Clostridiales bacterium]MCF8021775.1 DMT family transporter [Clostridiales bacterium]